MANFEWRANNGQQSGSGGSLDTGEGCLFVCSSEQTTPNPTLTLVRPASTTTIADSIGINPMPGDDLSPPNSVRVENMNGIAVPVSATAGWSVSPPTNDEGVYPSGVAYDVQIKSNNKNGTVLNDTMELNVALEYSNPRIGESMVVKVAVAKTLVNEESGTELALVATNFQEYLPDSQWVDITANVDYTKTADAVVDAVLQDPNAGQTAGKATITAKTVELTLGPFSAKARLNLTFQADHLYTYQAMSTRADAADIGSHRLLPLWLNLPFSPVEHVAGLSSLAVRLQAPQGTAVLPVDQYQEAYWNLKNQQDMKPATVLAVSKMSPTGNDDLVGCQFQWESLPPRSAGLLAWLALPNPVEENAFDFVHIGRSLEELANPTKSDTSTQTQVIVQVPSTKDASSLQIPLPGHGPMGSLYRLKVKMPKAQPRQQPYFIMNLTLSDKSGSTARRVGSVSMRDRFNQLAEVRFLKRLESIPALVRANVIRMDDVWMEAFLAFDSSAPSDSIRYVMFRVSDVHDLAIETVQNIRSGNNFAANRLPKVLQHVRALRGVSPGGATDFAVGPRTLVQKFQQWQKEAQAMASSAISPCTFVEFDTDGGHNYGLDYLDALKSLSDVYDVRDGVVTGFGSWLNQDCASKVARALGSVPALLALQVPEPGTEGLDKVFRTGFSAWVVALRKPPKMTLKLSAGFVAFPSPVASRQANALEVLGFRRIGESQDRPPKFGLPDVSDDTHTKAVVSEVPAGDELLVYVVSRLPGSAELERALKVQSSVGGSITPATGNVWCEGEQSSGSFLAFDWLSMLTCKPSKKSFHLSHLMATGLSSRLEDEVSFRFNIASPSGKTSYLGRCKTMTNRAPIDAAHQPASPPCPIKERPGSISTIFGHSPPLPALNPAFRAFCGTSGVPAPSTPLFRARVNQDGFHSSASHPSLAAKYGHEVTRSVGASFGPLASHSLSPQCGSFSFASKPPAPAPAFGSFGGTSGGLFGSCPAPAMSCPARPAASFGSPGPGSFGSPAPAPHTEQQREPSWRDALGIPAGSDEPLQKQSYDELLNGMSQIVHSKDRLKNDPSVNYVCDICGHQFTSSSETRYHCYDCIDFDACINCKHKHDTPFHRIAAINPPIMPAPQSEDPLVAGLLQQPAALSAPFSVSQAPAPQFDQTKEWCKLRVRRFLVSILHWWPVFRATCVFREKLPLSLGNEMAEKIAQSLQGDNLNDVLETLTVVVDSLMREHTAVCSNPYAQPNAS